MERTLSDKDTVLLQEGLKNYQFHSIEWSSVNPHWRPESRLCISMTFSNSVILFSTCLTFSLWKESRESINSSVQFSGETLDFPSTFLSRF